MDMGDRLSDEKELYSTPQRIIYVMRCQNAEKVRQLRSRLERILNVALRLRFRCFHRLRPCWTAILSILCDVDCRISSSACL